MKYKVTFLILTFVFFACTASGQQRGLLQDPGMSALNSDLVQIANGTGYFLELAPDLDLKDTQRKELEDLFFKMQTQMVRHTADLNVLDAELMRLLSSEKVEMSAVEGKVREIERIQSQVMIEKIGAALSAVHVLSHPQHLKVMLIMRSRPEREGLKLREG